eukprot:TRINITY_DN4067_c6_g1_i1.p1 TRINITY_DN4067_c6_g1~~TRINITY_DN4067_c6_g1_i1.p1  ORF type:complete len:451 (+),score=97.76 TRINITY_DN4067_c6_g1_i1:105-1457(+)
MADEAAAQATKEGEDYEFKDGLRLVKPYWHNFTVHVKGRWVGMTVLDMFCTDFTHQTRDYYEKAIKEGLIRINGEVVEFDRVLCHNELISHKMLREELPVLDTPVSIIAETPEFIAVHKPASMPVHPCGRYAKNTLARILRQEHGMTAFHPCHRLDKVTSGVLLLARSGRDAEKVGKMLRQEDDPKGPADGTSRRVQKQYLARVRGEFPAGPVCVTHPVACADPKRGLMKCVLPGDADFEQMEKQRQAKEGILASLQQYSQEQRGAAAAAAADAGAGEGGESLEPHPGSRKRKQKWVSAEAKQRKKEAFKQLSDAKAFDARILPRSATTDFERLCVVPASGGRTGVESIVRCSPRTGRTHQIRVHLQSLGHPIADDWLYAADPKAPSEDDELAMSIMLHAFRYQLQVDGKDYCFTAPLPAWAADAGGAVGADPGSKPAAAAECQQSDGAG